MKSLRIITLMLLVSAVYAEPATYDSVSSELTVPALQIDDPDCGVFESALKLDFENRNFELLYVKEAQTHFSPKLEKCNYIQIKE